ncbi:MAG: cytosine deaminase [Alistipes senegalensis]|nr:cytosine deaminase [Bacteroides cellulosilyticus]MCM1351952.1 cytosine deaminase [Alistipes senegalensis]
MTSARRIASNLLWTLQGVVRNPLVTFASDGRVLRVEQCATPDRQPATEFHAGLLVLDFPADYGTFFPQWCAERASLAERLPQCVPAPQGIAVVLSGLDYDGLRLTPTAHIAPVFAK